MELTIDTSTEIAGLALSSEGKITADLTWHAGRNHTVELIPSLISLMDQAKVGIKDMNGIIVASGPGSFNGLRVGMSTAKGFAYARKIPLVGISSLEAEAFPYAHTGMPVCPIISAGRGELAAAIFQQKDGKWTRILEEHITVVDELASRIEERTLFCGRIPEDAAMRLREILGEKADMADSLAASRRLAALTELGWKRLKEGDYDDPPTLQPLYLRKPAITKSKKDHLNIKK